jgi:flagellar protein FlgJ
MITSGLDNVPVYTDFQGLDKLKMMARDNPDKALELVARQFEALFTQTLLKSMRDTSLGEGLFDNDQSRLYQDLFDKQIASDLSQRKGMGLADVLVRQLSPKGIQTIDPTLEPLPAVNKFTSNMSSATATLPSPTVEFKSPDDYLTQMYPIAKEIEASHGIPASVILAQSALETGWGRHIINKPDGNSSYNLFGIKADSRWEGAIVSSKTVEYRNGIAEMSREKFRSYDSFKESMADYAEFLTNSPRYHQALENSADPHRFSIELQQAGYATDPEYSNKINKIMSSSGFVSILEAFKIGPKRPLT